MASDVVEERKVVLVKNAPEFAERFATAAGVLVDATGSVFILDFYRPVISIELDEVGRPRHSTAELAVAVRVFLTPTAAKALLKSLGDAVRAYEEKFGEIRVRAVEPENAGLEAEGEAS